MIFGFGAAKIDQQQQKRKIEKRQLNDTKNRVSHSRDYGVAQKWQPAKAKKMILSHHNEVKGKW